MTHRKIDIGDLEAMPETGGVLILRLLDRLSSESVSWVYLRNYENLPDEVGNDADILIPAGRRRELAEVLLEEAKKLGWDCVGQGEFSPLALYLANLRTGEILHIDLFDRLEWHCLEFADAGVVLANRKWNEQVFIPDENSEVYLNVVTRLLYHGEIREKHRSQASSSPGGTEGLREEFQRQLGSAGPAVVDLLAADAWAPSVEGRRKVRRAAWLRYGMARPSSLITGLWRYGRRVLSKILRPPGRFLVFEGADGVGKSTVLADIVPWCKKWCGGQDAYRFHWKPMHVSRDVPKGDAPVDPRGLPLRSASVSLMFLIWHVASFWWGYFRWVRPLLVKSHTVIGDRYGYDLFLDPRRFRLRLPDLICRAAALLVPKPDVAVALLAKPELIRGRKPELSHEEIASYQSRWRSLAQGRAHMVEVQADEGPRETIKRTKRVMLEAFRKVQ